MSNWGEGQSGKCLVGEMSGRANVHSGSVHWGTVSRGTLWSRNCPEAVRKPAQLYETAQRHFSLVAPLVIENRIE